ncbi:conserved hypothetical protein [Aspergillus terreus NIH2624]|uniref:Uncharacterized protein n=1 Tax=Aspergillus terreus (strain NIH 2624 / FGSC A1156) TaxID=341663 RepID=Q0C9Q7_ASPTN|nr:uncharacterized protein ATEG_09577 [Aspergillus terreus NIH2624]EAU29768.1 conserved hypothetical protein [Aspergillus terreus NIH2624]
MSKPDPLSWTLLFKKHKTTVLLMLPPSETIANAKIALLEALQSRGLKEINGDAVPEDPSDIELGIPVDKNDLEKGWTKLELDLPEFDEDGAAKRAGKKSASSLTLQAADVKNGKPIAFRFRQHKDETDQTDIDLELEDANWDVVLPNLDDEEEEPN